MMKKIIFVLALSVALTACTDILTLEPIDQLTEANFPATDADAIAAVNGIYSFNVISTSYSYLIDLTSEVEVSGENPSGAGGLLGSIQWFPSNSYFNSVWNATYQGVTSANTLIDRLEVSPDVTPALKNRLIGEAKFLRAYYYQYAVQFWGEVPLILHASEGEGATRAPVDDVYEQIINDFSSAAELLPDVSEYSGSDKGRATKGAAYAFIGKIYLVWSQVSNTGEAARLEKLRKSIDALNKVTGYELEEDYIRNWAIDNKNGKENIFAAQHTLGQVADGSGSNHLAHCAFSSGYTNALLPHMIISDIKYYNVFDDRDQRKNATYAKTFFNPATGEDFEFELPRYRKYIDDTDPFGTASNRNIDRTIIRYAEVFLLRAEALNELNNGPTSEAYHDINIVRRRAFRQPLHESSEYDIPAGLNYESFKKKIQDERLFELTYEQNRRLDLIRWKIYVKTLKDSDVPEKQNVSLKNYRFPLPQSQRNINPEGLWQNWGYDGYDESKTGANPYAGFE